MEVGKLRTIKLRLVFIQAAVEPALLTSPGPNKGNRHITAK